MKEISVPSVGRSSRRALIIVAVLTAYAALTVLLYRRSNEGHSVPAQSHTARVLAPPARTVAIENGMFHMNGAPLIIKAVGWDPVRPGDVPWKRAHSEADVMSDLSRIRAAGFNTVRTWAALNAQELELAAKHDLYVLQGIWVPPEGPFADPAYRRKVLEDVRKVVETSRWSSAVLGYLVMNEPRARAVAEAGLDTSLGLLREVVATVHALDPDAPVGYASWPGLEPFHDDLLDFVAFNLYPHRPRVVMDELGVASYVRMVDRTIARGRPLLITEFGISVSPGRPLRTPGRGGATEAEQAEGLVDLASTFLRSGASGLSVFQWSDGWWKNDEAPGDELEHDPLDPEEWFGLVRFESIDDRVGTPRPALERYQDHQRAMLVEPRDGRIEGGAVPIRVFSEEPVRVRVGLDGMDPAIVPLSRDGAWHVGSLQLREERPEYYLQVTIEDADGAVITREQRVVVATLAEPVELRLTPTRIDAVAGKPFEVTVARSGIRERPSRVTIVTYTEDRYNEERQIVTLGDEAAKVVFNAEEPGLLTVLAFESDEDIPEVERAVAWTFAEVRRSR
jgi:hypothetical protein